MRPYPDEVLRAIQSAMGAQFAPEIQSTYGKAQVAYASLLFILAQREYDSAVPDLIDENMRLRGLLADAGVALASVEGEAADAGRGTLDALPEPAASLRLSDQRRERDGLRAAIAALAPVVEPADDEPSLAPLREVRRSIFAYLAEDAQKRSFPILSA